MRQRSGVITKRDSVDGGEAEVGRQAAPPPGAPVGERIGELVGEPAGRLTAAAAAHHDDDDQSSQRPETD